MEKANYRFELIKGEVGEPKFAISTEGLDRGMDIMKVNGANLKTFNKNPVVYSQHESRKFPVGKGPVKKEKVEINEEMVWALTSTPTFSEEEEAQTVKRLVEGGFLRAASIGYHPIDWEDSPLPEELQSLAFVRNMWRPEIRTHKQWDLLEWSIVGIPMNPDALRVKSADALEKGLISEKDLEVLKEYLKEEKAGAVLNTKNKKHLKDAQDKIQSVLDSAEKSIENNENDSDQSNKNIKEEDMRIEDVKELLKGAFDELNETLKPVLDFVEEQKEAQEEQTKQAKKKEVANKLDKIIEDSISKVSKNKKEE